MVAMAYDTVPMRAEGFTVEDLAEMPDDGRRYEIVDGVLVVSPAPRPRHQLAACRLGEILTRASPPDLVVIPAPIDVPRGPRVCLAPDLVVVRKADLDLDDAFRETPVLVVEIVSPSSLDLDLGLKLRVYARLGVPHYWVLHPREHWVKAHELRDGALQLRALAVGEEVCVLKQPFAVRFRPRDLLAPFEAEP
jgi:Uma2 family endonuclease